MKLMEIVASRLVLSGKLMGVFNRKGEEMKVHRSRGFVCY